MPHLLQILAVAVLLYHATKLPQQAARSRFHRNLRLGILGEALK